MGFLDAIQKVTKADIVIQDCECIGVDTNKTMNFKSGVHANYAQISGYPSANFPVLPDDIKKKLLLSHYQDFVLNDKDFFGNDCLWDNLAHEDGLAGFVRVGQVIEL